MFDQIFERSDALRRQLAGPLREARLAYLRHRAEQGAPRSTLRKLAQYLLVVTERLNLQPRGTVTTAQIERAALLGPSAGPRNPPAPLCSNCG